MNLRFDINSQAEEGVHGHACAIISNLGIKYQHAIPQSMGDQWWFIDCEVVGDLAEETILSLKYISKMEFTEQDRKKWLKQVR